METLNTTPAYQHDCDACTYLGTLCSKQNGLRDLYHCADTYIVRVSSVAPDYDAMPAEFADMIGGDYARAKALRAAIS